MQSFFASAFIAFWTATELEMPETDMLFASRKMTATEIAEHAESHLHFHCPRLQNRLHIMCGFYASDKAYTSQTCGFEVCSNKAGFDNCVIPIGFFRAASFWLNC